MDNEPNAVNTPEPSETPAVDSPKVEIPDGYHLVSDSDLQGYRRNAERVSGADKFYEAAKTVGFEKAEDFAPWSGVVGGARERGVDPLKLAEIFGPSAPDPSGDEPVDSDQLVQRIMGEVDKRFSRTAAVSQWEDGRKREVSLVDEALSGFDGLSEFNKKVFASELKDRLDGARQVYPEGHPLENEAYQPVPESRVKEIVDAFQKEASEAIGVSLHERGEAAKKTPPTTVSAGNTGGQGKPEQSERTTRGFDRDAMVAKVEKARKARAGSPMSSLGG